MNGMKGFSLVSKFNFHNNYRDRDKLRKAQDSSPYFGMKFVHMGDLPDPGLWKRAVVVYDIEKNINKGHWKDQAYGDMDAVYEFSSNNNRFQPGKISNSVWGTCYGNGEQIRLDIYPEWVVKYIEIIE